MAAVNRKQPNVILITVDGLRADHLGCCGYDGNTSPNIDNLASTGALFQQAISNGGGTPEGFPSILASALPPLHHDEFSEILKRSTTLPEVLRRNGYATAAFHSCPFLTRSFHYDKGFSTFVDNMRPLGRIHEWQVRRFLSNPKSRFYELLGLFFDLLVIGGLHIANSDKINSRVVSWLKKNHQKFFIWIHYMDTHRMSTSLKVLRRFGLRPISRFGRLALHRRAKNHPNLLSEHDLQLLVEQYDASIRYVDNCIGSLLYELGGRLANTITIVTGDHGDEFGEHGNFGHRTLYDEILRIPLIINGPGISAQILVKEQVSQLDIAPTIVDLLNLGEVEGFRGESLLPAMKGKKRGEKGTINASIEPKKGERRLSYRTEGWKYIRTEKLESTEVIQKELYDLRNDPKELRNLEGTEKEKEREFELKIRSFYFT